MLLLMCTREIINASIVLKVRKDVGLLKPGIRDPGSAGTGHGTNVVILSRSLIYLLPLAINKSDGICIVIACLKDLLQRIDHLYYILYINIHYHVY